ncbi:MAG: hypothetical protein ACKVU4_06325 [Phycisphaerales bacterium]
MSAGTGVDERAAMTATIARISARTRRAKSVSEVFADVRDRYAGTPEQRATLRRRATIVGPIAAVVLGVGVWLVVRPMPQPDYERGNLRRVFTFTLLSDEFNKLSVQERLALVKVLVDRVKNMSASESALMAAFAAGVSGAAREQIEENISKLGIDMWYEYSAGYADVPLEDRDAYLDRVFLEMSRNMEAVGGVSNEDSDAERLAEAREQAQRDMKMVREGRGPSTGALTRVYTFLRDDVASHASAAQKSRGQLMMRDMVRRMRGESVRKPGGG